MNSYHEIDADVIIIGAGLSGLTAAYTILEKAPFLKILVLEASDRIGGRIVSLPINDFICDIGGQWICSQQSLLADLMFKLGIAKEINLSSTSAVVFVEYNSKLHKVKRCDAFSFCSSLEKFELSGFIRKIDEMCNLPTIDPALQYISMEEFLNDNVRSTTIQTIIKYTILTHCGIEASEITVWFYIFFCISTHGIANQLIITGNGMFEYSVKGGAIEICKKLAARIQNKNILTERKVTSIINNLHDVEIKTTQETFFCYNVIVAIPPPELTQIQYTPKLPNDKLWILNHANSGNLIKFVINYKERFWKKNNRPGDIYIINGYNSKRPILFCLDCSINKSAILTGYAINSKNLENNILEELKGFLGDMALEPLSFTSTNSLQNLKVVPLISFDYMGDCVQMFKSHRRMFWAGAETSLNWYGHIAGAVFAGKRSALEVLYDLRPSLLTIDDMSIASPTLENIRRKQRRYNDFFSTISSWYCQVPIGAVVLYFLYKMWKKCNFLELIKTRS